MLLRVRQNSISLLRCGNDYLRTNYITNSCFVDFCIKVVGNKTLCAEKNW